MTKFCSQIQHHFAKLSAVAALVAIPTASVMAAPPPPPQYYPEIFVSGMTQLILDGQGGTSDFDATHMGDIGLGGSTYREYVVHNSGDANLTISQVLISGAHASDFTVVSQPPATIAPGATGTFGITFAPGDGGYHEAVVAITNNDLDEGEYTFRITGSSSETAPAGVDLDAVFVSYKTVGCKGIPLLYCKMQGRIDVYNLSNTNDLGLGVIRVYATEHGTIDDNAHLVYEKPLMKLKMQSIRKSSKPKKVNFKGNVPPNFGFLHAVVEPIDGSRDTDYSNNLAVQQYGNF